MRQWEIDEMRHRVDAAMAYAGLNADELAERLKFSKSSLNRKRIGEYEWRPGDLFEIARVCRVPLWFLRSGWPPATAEELREVGENLPDGPPET